MGHGEEEGGLRNEDQRNELRYAKYAKMDE